ncbi:MAG: hypothetical protein CVU56_10955 [Deltaproteobacteria bacterium HGW-Deltaproteobacteria-14]|nr:MAG: hypothetical protein CVU56_10955 [Deltaproteobacteria bacterium HGW-Deltaproteobacteria-14]
MSGKSAEGLLDKMSGGGGGGAATQRAVQRKGGPGTKEGITGGKVDLEDYSGGREPNADEVAKAKRDGAGDDIKSMAKQVELISTGTARSERDMLSAIKAGTTPRYIARVGARDDFSWGTFGNPTKPFIFATEPADLRGAKPAEAMLKVGWEKSWITPKVGKEIVVCIFDTTKSVPNKDLPDKTSKVKQGRMEWPQLTAKALGDSKFIRAAAAKGIDKAELPDLMNICSLTPVKGDFKTDDPDKKRKCGILRGIIDEVYSANALYSGMGATIEESGKLGGREVMVEENGTGLKLTPSNHSFASLGTLTQEECDKI